jgi:hypothetical protein
MEDFPMPGILTNGYTEWDGTSAQVQGGLIPVDTNLAQGESPQSVAVTVESLGLGASVALTDAATIAIDASDGSFFYALLGGNRVLGNPTNLVNGQKLTVKVKQDGTGSRLLTYGSKWAFPGGAPTASTAANAIDVINGVYDEFTDKIYAVMTKAYS